MFPVVPKMSFCNVSNPISTNMLDLLDTQAVNLDQSTHAELVIFMIILIPVVNIPIIRSVHNDNSGTFLNKLVLLDCVNGLAHVPIVLQQYQ